MAAGCPIIIRPSETTPIAAYAIGALCYKIGLPAGVVQIPCTDGYDAANGLMASLRPAMVTLIGSSKTGKHIMRTGATSIKRYSMELGGNAPVLVFAAADLDLAADIVAGFQFSNSRQICVSPSRILSKPRRWMPSLTRWIKGPTTPKSVLTKPQISKPTQ
jgi:succinate-semialdehyde dehydrogenase/glutarate-semialdehyde dehydrogenase